MATLLIRGPELAAVEKLSMASREQGRLQQEKAGTHGEHEGLHRKVSSEGRGRARKVKSAQKKQPQRGLGVAQLEKLRMQEQSKQEESKQEQSKQEQSKQEAVCLASFQGFPPFGFMDQNGGMKNGTMSHQPVHSTAFSFCNDRTGPSDKLHYLSGDGRQLSKVAVDGETFRAIMSFANVDHSTTGSFARRARGGQSAALMFAQNREIRDHSYGCNSIRTVSSLGSLSERPGSRGQGSCETSVYVEGSSGKLPSCAQACLGSPPSSTAKSSLLSNSFPAGANLVDSLASNLEHEVQRLSEVDRESVHMFQVTSKGVGDAGMVDTKLFPAVGRNSAMSVFTPSSLQCFESSSGPAKLRRLPQDRAEVPTGVAINCGRPKELSSFQSFSSNNTWSATEKVPGQKRPWYDIKEDTCKSMHSEDLDLNAPAGEVQVAQSGCYGGVSDGHVSPVGVHHTTGVSGGGPSNTLLLLKDKACAPWQENYTQNLSIITDVGFHSVESFLKVSCPSKSKIKDCCSSVCSPCGSPVTRQRCLSSPDVPMLTGAETSGDFLTLGISSRSYPTSPQFGVEVDSKESMSPEEGNQVKRMRNSQALDSALHLQMFYRHEESAPSVMGGIYSPSCTDTSLFSAVGLSCRFTSTSSSNVTEDCHKQTGRQEKREFLDLNLKLAL
ncbi:uncharacterized protein [Physcomitrium patens]|uniref:uncharacterized protein isoform X2 n=1 Tax=Physcomitrium patens TaxID=3218 RepID=UPI000D1739A1|nr:uncharacterized protein LOC112285485 isoform X2 [Physcomitrium patens]|eukprot:XP_024382135.1 uncharacterized protein LOC112285485 isoform X2 [Physcomitrella patens]